jgi:hypothetical protein
VREESTDAGLASRIGVKELIFAVLLRDRVIGLDNNRSKRVAVCVNSDLQEEKVCCVGGERQYGGACDHESNGSLQHWSELWPGNIGRLSIVICYRRL